MIIGIIAAMDEELSILLEEMNVEKTETKAQMKFNFGRVWGKDVVAVRCGVGKVNAAMCTQILVDDFKVDRVINVGVAGGTGVNVMPGDVVIADSLVQHDMDTSVFGDRIGQIPRFDGFDFKSDAELVEKAKNAAKQQKGNASFVGRIVTGDQFINDPEKVRWMCREFDAMACEMEGASIAHVCTLNSVPFVVIRSISDNANNGAHMDYRKFIPIAVNNSTSILRNMLNDM